MSVLGNGAVVTGGFDTAIIEWNLATGVARRVLRFHGSSVNALVGNGADCFVSGGEDGRIALWCAGTDPVATYAGNTGPVAALAVSADGARLASAGWDGKVRLWVIAPNSRSPSTAVSNGVVVAEHAAPVTGVAFAPDGQTIFTASHDGEVRRSEVAGVLGGEVRMLHRRQLPTAINGLVAFGDGRIALAAADGQLRVLDGDLSMSFTVALDDGPTTTLALTPDGRQIGVAGARAPVKLIDLETRRVLRAITAPGLPTWALAFTHDGRELLTGGADRALRRWNVATGTIVGEMAAPSGDPSEGRTPEEGARVFRACIACHTTRAGDGHWAGPTLHGIMGRRIATAAGYEYSDALKAMNIVWTPETIAKLFEVGPNAYTPGTKMPEQRISDPADRRALVEWLERVTRP